MRGHPGEHRLARRVATRRVQRPAGDRRAARAGDRRAAVERLAAAVAHPPQPAGPDRDLQRAAGEPHPDAVRRDRRRCPRAPARTARSRSTSSTRPCRTGRPAGRRGELVPADAVHAAHHEQRAPQLAHVAVLDPGALGRHVSSSSRRQDLRHSAARRPRRRRGSTSSRARTRPARSTSSMVVAATPRATSRWQASTTSSTTSSSAAPFAAGARRVVAATARSAAAPRSRSSRPASSTTRSWAGQRGGADQLGQRGEPVGLGEQRREPSRGASPARVAVRGVPGAHGVGVPGERPGPAHRRVVPGVGEVPVEQPQRPDEPLGAGGHRLGHVPAGRRDGADHGDRRGRARRA